MESARIVALAVIAAVTYGILQDLVTTRVCIEYFTIGHPRIIASESPLALAFLWGTIATWWVGLPLGGVLALSSRIGARPKLSWRHLLRPLATTMAVVGILATLAGFAGYGLARAAHLMAYIAGIVSGLTLCVIVWRRRASEASRRAVGAPTRS